MLMHDAFVGTSVLVIDGDKQFLEYVAKVLGAASADLSIEVCYTLHEARGRVAIKQFDLVVLDVALANEAALEFAQAVPGISFVLSSRNGETFPCRGILTDDHFAQHVVGYLQKPIPPGAVWYLWTAARAAHLRRINARTATEGAAQIQREGQEVGLKLQNDLCGTLAQLSWELSGLENFADTIRRPGEKSAEVIELAVARCRGLIKAANSDITSAVARLEPTAIDVLGLKHAIGDLVEAVRVDEPGIEIHLSVEDSVDDIGRPHAGAVYDFLHSTISEAARRSGTSRVSIDVGLAGQEISISGLAETESEVTVAPFDLSSIHSRVIALGGVVIPLGKPVGRHGRFGVRIPVPPSCRRCP